MHLKLSSAKWRSFCLGGYELKNLHFNISSAKCRIFRLTLCGILQCHFWWLLLLHRDCFHAQFSMMTSSNGSIFCVTCPLCGEFPSQRPVTRSFNVFFDMCLSKRSSNQSWGWWSETPSHFIMTSLQWYIRSLPMSALKHSQTVQLYNMYKLLNHPSSCQWFHMCLNAHVTSF